MTTTDISTAEARRLQPALLRAQDERMIRDHGPLVAVLRSKTVEAGTRRAALALTQHWHGKEKVEPHEIVPVLGMARLLNRWEA